jgi:hypothetical protein
VVVFARSAVDLGTVLSVSASVREVRRVRT